MQLNKKQTLSLFLCFAVIFLTGIGITYVYAVVSTATYTISSGIQTPYSFIVWSEGLNYFAKNSSGYIVYSGTNASDIIANTISETNGTILFKSGIYTISYTIYILGNNFITLIGEGRDNTILKNNALTTTMISLGDGSSSDNDFNGRLTIRDLQFHGNDKNVNIIYLNNVASNNFNLHTFLVLFRNFGTDPAIDQNTKWFIDCVFDTTSFWFGDTSMIVEQPSHQFINCHFWELNNGIYMKNGAGCNFFGGVFSHNTRDVSFQDSVNYPDVYGFYGTWFEDSADVIFGSGESNITQLVFIGCNFHTSGTYVFYLPTCNGLVTIIGGQVRTGSGTSFEFGNMNVNTTNFEAYP